MGDQRVGKIDPLKINSKNLEICVKIKAQIGNLTCTPKTTEDVNKIIEEV